MSVPYGIIFAVLAGVSALVAVLAEGRLWPLRAAGAAAAISFLVVAIAYLGAGPRLLFKKVDGQRHPAAWLVHWPYFALTTFAYHAAVLTSRGAAVVQVAPNVYLGRRLTARESRAADGWVAVLDLVAEMPEPRPLRAVPGYRSLPVLDATAMPLEQLRDAVSWVQLHAATGPVYVHCAFGHGRSALVAAAYLLATGLAADAKAAVKRLRELRPGVRLNRPQRKVLTAFATEAPPLH